MNKEIVKSERLGESYSVFHHPSGLDVLVWKMEGFTTTEAIFATKYGSISRPRTAKISSLCLRA